MSTGPELRSSKQTDPLSESELKALQKQLHDRERRLRDEAQKLDRERRQMEEERAEKDRLHEELGRANHRSQRELPPASLEFAPPPQHASPEPWEYTLREAVSTIPTFDGQNMAVLQFARACRRARDILPRNAERTLTRLIMTRLRGRAATALEDESATDVVSLCDRLKDIFGPNRSVDHYRGEMANIFMKPSEHILDYISRVKDLRDAILDCTREHDHDVDELAKNSFIDGLIPRIRSEVRVTHNETLSRTFDTAIRAYKQMELDQRRYGRTDDKYSRDATFDRRAAAPRYTPPEERQARNPPRFREEPRFEGNRREYEPRREPAYRRDDRHSQESYRNTQRRTDDRTNIRREEPRRREQAYPADNNRSRTPPTVCNYCKFPGHDIHQCRKRQFANSQTSGNGESLPRTQDHNREGTITKPVRVMTQADERHESPLSECTRI